MNNQSDVTAARDLALQKIGRNVVNFQKMEAMLKFILQMSNYSIPIAKAAEHVQRETSRLKARPMGDLVDRAAKALHSEPQQAPLDIQEIWISTSLKIGDSDSDFREWRREMRRMVSERNRLIHHMLVSFNPTSVESCHALCADLDAQREQVIPIYEHLQSLAGAILEQNQYLASNVDEIVAGIVALRSAHDAQQTHAANRDT